MTNKIMWWVCWFLIRKLLGVAKFYVEQVMVWVAEANELQHPDGTPYTGDEKYAVVYGRVLDVIYLVNWKIPGKCVYNLLIEMAVAYSKMEAK